MTAGAALLAVVLASQGLAPQPDTLAQVSSVALARSTTVAVALVVPHGSGGDPEGKAGASWLLAYTLSSEANRRVEWLSGRVTPTVSRGQTAFTLLATPPNWKEALATLLEVVFRTPPRAEAFQEVRGRLLDQLHFEEDAPVRRFQQEVDNLIHGSAHPWSWPVRGNPVSVESVSLGDLESLRGREYRQAESVAMIVGPDSAEVVGMLASGSSLSREAETPSPGAAWTRGDRITLERQVTNTWVAVAYPLSPDLSRTRAEFLSHTLQDALVPTPSDPWLFGAQVQIRESVRGPILVITAAVLPEMARRWEDRVLAEVANVANERTDPALFRLQRRRFRSAALLEEGFPEVLSRKGALDLLRGDPVRHADVEIAALRPRDLRDAADGLGPPRILVLGPDLSQETWD